jgi:outer membrane immunogenic protein
MKELGRVVRATLVVLPLGCGVASAADLAVKARAPAIAPEVFSWTGFYVGANAGYDWGRADISGTQGSPVPPFFAVDNAAVSAASSPSLKPSGFTGGGQVGYNWQTGSTVLGVEADIEAFRLRASTVGTFQFPSTLPGGGGGAPAFFTSASSVSTDWLFTGRGRLGWANTNWLLYATGGVAVTNASVNQTIALLAPFVWNVATSSTRVGWTVGAGFEYAFNRNWSVKGEYLYLDFGNLNGVGVLTPPSAGFTYTNSTHLTANIARVGVNYHFNGPVVAKY